MIPTVLTIAGSDSGGGAGIQADLAAFRAFGVHGASAITAITAQNTLGISAIHEVPLAMLRAQIEAVLADFEVKAVKIGMVPSPDHIGIIAEILAGTGLPVVLDPVLSASTGRALGRAGTPEALREHLLPLVAALTPNLPEAAALLAVGEAADEEAMRSQASALLAFGPRAVLLKGGHGSLDEAIDMLATEQGITRFAAPWVETTNLHGTGCALSAALAAGIALGHPLDIAVARAKSWLRGRLIAGAGLRIGHGKGPALSPEAV
ncbi:bifunctional hydroxymethylpyrimidine kinase/phosphomethylpyrimidine kinase [Labrys okinawensis]|uniref:bifunctional hydroxymethylpyrimidine kinase/phosphomethylpyrimidine kinase n=1 Tax=Labrys okinawensis TaxID=346911 RepID=UPI0039BD6A94